MAKGDELRRVGRAVAARRGELGMTQQELADAAGVDLKTIYNLESGTRWPIAKTRVAVSAALGWEADALADIATGAEPAQTQHAAPVLPAAAAPGLEHADIIPAMSPAMKTAARPYRDEIAAALGVAAALWGVPAEHLRGEQVFGPGDLARQWDYVMDAGLALFPPDGYPVGARAWMVAIAQVRRDEKRAHGGEEAGLCAPIRG